MRVLHITTEFPPLVYGGLGTAVGALASASVRHGVEVTVLLVGWDGEACYQRPTNLGPGLDGTLSTPCQAGVHVLPASHRLAEEIGVQWTHEWRPDVLHLHSFWLWPVAEGIRRRTGVPIVYTVHSLDKAEYEIGEGPPECLMQWHIQERAIRQSDAVVALTRAECELIDNYVPDARSRVHVVGNGIDVAGMPAGSAARRSQSNDALTVLFSGRFVERKGVQELLAAIPRVLEHDSTIRFVLAGGYRGCQGEDLARRWFGADFARCADRVHFCGWLDSSAMAARYAQADILVVPSWYEPFGMVVLEGMLHGLAVAASDVGGPQEILEHEVSGLLFPPRDSRSLAGAICRLADSQALRERLGRAAEIEVRRRWSYVEFIRRMVSVYRTSQRQGCRPD